MAKEPIEVTEYEILSAQEEGDLSRRVTKCLTEGWSLHGSPFNAEYMNHTRVFCQAVTRTTKMSESLYKAKVGQT